MLMYLYASLIAKWRKQGYEKLCCLRCIQTNVSILSQIRTVVVADLRECDQASNFQGSTCICRIPKAQLKKGQVVECNNCGCRGCASSD